MTLPFVQLAIYLIVVFGDLGSSIYNRYYLETHDQVGYTAHLGGSILFHIQHSYAFGGF